MQDDKQQFNLNAPENRPDPATDGGKLHGADGQPTQNDGLKSGAGDNPSRDNSPARGESRSEREEEALRTLGERTVEPPKKRKYGWIGNVLFLIVIGLSIWMMTAIITELSGDDDSKSFVEVVTGGDWRFALISLAVLLVMITCVWFQYVVVMKSTTGKWNIKTSLKVALLGKFYDNITPFASGGQPMQIYYLHKKGYSGGVSSAVILIKYFCWMICWLIVSIVFMACNTAVLNGLDSARKTVLLVAGWFGIGINALLPLGVILFVTLPRLARKLASGVVWLGYKVKIVKDREKTMEKAAKVVSDFRSSFAIISAHPLHLIALVLLCTGEVLLSFSFPYFIMRMYSGLPSDGGFSLLAAVTAINIYVSQSVAIIPTPGNTGAMEGLGALAFSMFVTGSVQFWSMFTWRFAVYYIYIVIGIGITVFELIRKLVRSRRAKAAGRLSASTGDPPADPPAAAENSGDADLSADERAVSDDGSTEGEAGNADLTEAGNADDRAVGNADLTADGEEAGNAEKLADGEEAGNAEKPADDGERR